MGRYIVCVLCFLLVIQARAQIQSEVATPLSEKLYEILQQEKSIEKTLWRLDEIDPTLRNNFVLVYRSQSAQEGSFRNPRALLYTKSANFVLTFNGHPSQRGYSNLEMLEFNAATSRFVLRDLKLSSDALGNKTVTFSEKNPQNCVKCHQAVTRVGVDPKPNWEPHQHWFGVYGSLDGLAGYANWFYKRNNDQSLEEIVNLQRATELDNLNQNSKSVAEHNKIDKELTVEAQEYAAFWDAFANKTLAERYLVLRPRESVLLKFPEPLTAYFSRAISERNYERVIRIISEIPEFKYNKEFLRYCLQSVNFGGADKQGLFVDSTDQVTWNNQYTKSRFRKTPTAAVPRDNDGTCIEWVFEAMGYNTSDWSVDFFSGARFSKSSRFGGPDYPKTDFLKVFSEKYPKPQTVYTEEGTLLFDSHDSPLLKSQKAFSYYQSKSHLFREDEKQRLEGRDYILLASGEKAPEAYGHCIRCHAQPQLLGAPAIPFQNLSELNALGPENLEKIKNRLSANVSDALKMPPDAVMSQNEKDQIVKFLEQSFQSINSN